MDYNLVSPDKLKVTLTRQDLDTLGVSSENLDYSDPDSRNALISILEEGRTQTGFNPRRSKLYIEVYPYGDGGCVLYYTRLAVGEAFAPVNTWDGPNPVVFAFSDVETLINACAKTLAQYGHRIYKSSLFKTGEEYRLIVLPLDYTDRLSVDFLCEFGDLTGEGAVISAFIEEHGILICKDNAIEKIAALNF